MNPSGPSSPSIRLQVYLLRLASLLGAAVSLLLVRQHVEFAINGALESSLCQVGGWFDCEAIEASGYASFFRIPVASVGLCYFALLSAVAWLIPPRTGTQGVRQWQGLFGWLTLPAVVAVWGLAMLSALVIESFCLGCTIVYSLTLLCAAAPVLAGPSHFFASLRGTAALVAPAGIVASLRHPATRKRSVLVLGGVLIAAAVNFGLPVWMIRDTARTPIVAVYFRQPAVELERPREGLSEGDPAAPIQIIVFTDFACPFCARFEEDLAALLAERQGEYFLGFKHFPLSRECNPIMSRASFDHANACRLAQMAEALAGMGRFTELRDRLYMAGDVELYPVLKKVAVDAGLDYGAWSATAVGPEVRRRVESDIEEGLKLGVQALPAVYVNGRPLPSIDPEKVEAILNAIEDGGK